MALLFCLAEDERDRTAIPGRRLWVEPAWWGSASRLCSKATPGSKVAIVAASARSAGQTYRAAVGDRWALSAPMPERIAAMTVLDASRADTIASEVDFVFCAVDMSKDETRALEDAYAKRETPVISNNSAHRGTPDVPVIVPEVNPDHASVIEAQCRRLGTRRGFVTAKPNCSIQSYVPVLHPLLDLGPTRVVVATYQALSGAGKTCARLVAGDGGQRHPVHQRGGREERSSSRSRSGAGSRAKASSPPRSPP